MLQLLNRTRQLVAVRLGLPMRSHNAHTLPVARPNAPPQQEAAANLARYPSLAALLAAAAANPAIAAVTPAGETKRRLRPPVRWLRRFVQRSVVAHSLRDEVRPPCSGTGLLPWTP